MRIFLHNGNKYRLVGRLFTFELQIKVNHRYEHLEYVKDFQDAINLLLNKKRDL